MPPYCNFFVWLDICLNKADGPPETRLSASELICVLCPVMSVSMHSKRTPNLFFFPLRNCGIVAFQSPSSSKLFLLISVLFTFSTCCILRYFVCIVVVILCVFLSSCVYLLYYMCIFVFTLDAGLLARSQYSEGLATGHLDTGFPWFPCA